MSKYQPHLIESKWQEAWKSAGLYRVDLKDSRQSKVPPKARLVNGGKVESGNSKKGASGKYYLLVELPYPSGDLHMGHWFTFAVADILGRLKKMQGYNVFFPVGFDAFGLPAENAAIKRGINPRDWTYGNIDAMKKQFATMGGMHDFEHGVTTCDSDYYRWNQWIFLKMFEKGLAYRGKTLSNWCPKDQTVLANENVENGKCWRCGTEVIQKEIPQWFLKITDYAERLLWPEVENVIIVPGCPDNPGDNKNFDEDALGHWIVWTRKQLNQAGIKTTVVKMPKAWDPVYQDWKKEFEKEDIGINSVLVGHSCGGAFLVRWLSETGQRVKKIILVAPSKVASEDSNQTRKDFYNFEISAQVRDKAKEIIIFVSNDDERILESVKIYQKSLDGKVVELPDKGHFLYEQMGTEEFPELLDAIGAGVDWPKPVREGQNNWIGKSEGIEINFPLLFPGHPGGSAATDRISNKDSSSGKSRTQNDKEGPRNDIEQKTKFVILHGRTGTPGNNFIPWLKENLEKMGYQVFAPQLPNSISPSDDEQADFVKKNIPLDENTVIVGHSFGGVVALRLLEQGIKVKKVVFACTPVSGDFLDDVKRPTVTAAIKKGFDFKKIKESAKQFTVVSDLRDPIVPLSDGETLSQQLEATFAKRTSKQPHFLGKVEPELFDVVIPSVRVFTKFPETIFGVTFMVVAPEHPLVASLLNSTLANTPGVSQGSLHTPGVDKDVEEVRSYVAKAKKKSELERMSADKQKSGVFTGLYCINPVNNHKVPIWVADYVIGGYGTGAVMGVPGSDVRDFDFAKKYDLPIIQVIASEAHPRGVLGRGKVHPGGETKSESSFTRDDVLEEGYIVNSGQFDGTKTPDPAKGKFKDFLEQEGWGARKINYHLHDWSMSRQRYWGTPIPIIYCVNCGEMSNDKFQMSNVDGKQYAIIPVPEKDLPVELPDITDYAPHGKPPLATATDWVNVKCPNCGGKAQREVETMDTFIDSSWYFLAYLNDRNPDSSTVIVSDSEQENGFAKQSSVIASETKQSNLEIATPLDSLGARNDDGVRARPWNPQYVKEWMPVDIYIGGAEHTLGHTLYSRFFVKFLHDIGLVPFSEYAQKRVHHGVILGPDGQRMSKSKGNVVNPDDQVREFGADAVRMYLAFLGPYDLVAPWNPTGINGVYHFLQRVWDMGQALTDAEQHADKRNSVVPRKVQLGSADLNWMHRTIKKVGEDIAEQKFNTAVAVLMEWLNYLSRKAHRGTIDSSQLTIDKKESNVKGQMSTVTQEEYKTLLLLLAPFAPHMTEEIWQALKANNVILEGSGVSRRPIGSVDKDSIASLQNDKGNAGVVQRKVQRFSAADSIHSQPWPQYDARYLKTSKVNIVVQVNGKVRDNMQVDAGILQEDVEGLAKQSEKVKKHLEEKEPKKVIFVPDKLLNFVV